MKSTVSIFLLLLSLQGLSQRSVLSTGSWYKISTEKEGIYEISTAYLVNSLGIDLNDFDPSTFKVYGNGGKLLPQSNSHPRPHDLNQLAIKGVGTEDGSMDPGDKFLFYAPAVDSLSLNQNGIWTYKEHHYSDKNYFFLTFKGEKGNRILEKESTNEDFPEVTAYDDFEIINEREIKLPSVNSGRNWYSFVSGRSSTYTFSLNDITGKLHFTLSGGIDSETNTYFEIILQDGNNAKIPFTGISQGTYDPIIEERQETVSFDGASENQRITINVDAETEAEQLGGYINFLIASFSRPLSISGTSLIFSSSELLQSSGANFSIQNASEVIDIWSLSKIIAPVSIPFSPQGGQANFSVEADTASIQRFAAILRDGNLTPNFESTIDNQNLYALDPQDGIIISFEDFIVPARNLAKFHQNFDNLDIAVVTLEQVYNEFSGGVPDVTAIRDFTRYLYLKHPQTFKYLLLFGDCSYDYKDIRDNNTNLVPTYQSRNSVDPVLSYASDDYFGFMEEHEGYWEESASGDHTLEVGVGRLSVNTLEDAEAVVNKIISYASGQPLFGTWKNKITYVVDDGDGNLHMEDAEDFSTFFEEFVPKLSIEKLYIDRFEQQGEGRNQSSPEAKEALLNTINQGTFMVNFIGHGNENTWMDESILDVIDISELKNGRRLPIFMTATCEFGRYDEPVLANGYSGAELLLIKENGGAIALLTTARPVYASSNYFINAAFHSFLFDKEEGRLPRLGDIVRKTKNASLRGARNRNFTLLGDPFLTPVFPKYEISFDEINGKSFNASDTISALELVTITGSIRDLDGLQVNSFNGIIDARILDRPTEQKTKGQENSPFVFSIQDNTIFNGQASVENGTFELVFTVPKNISYRYDNGKIEAYATDETNGIDASSATRNIRIGGTATDISEETGPPEIEMYLNDISFKNGDKVGTSAIFIAELKDESGINSTGLGISQDITLTLSTGRSYVLNNYYTASIDSYQEGKIVFPLTNLPPGKHTAKLKVFDIHNNLSTQEVTFTVSEEPTIRLFNVRNYPNPVTESFTSFAFEHDRAGESLEIDILLYNSEGAIIDKISFTEENSSRNIENLRFNFLSKAYRAGIYFYHLKVKSNLDGAIGESAGKMIKRN